MKRAIRVSLAVVLWVMLPSTVQAQESVYVTASAVNVRASASVATDKVGRVERGARLEVVRRADGWVEVRLGDGQTGWVRGDFVGSEPPKAPAMSDGEIRKRLIAESIAGYSGSCPCPYHSDRAGRSCGRRSAYSRPGGAAPLCYPRDVSAEAIARYRARLGE